MRATAGIPPSSLPDNDPQTLLALTFSGGGTRAAAFSFGVLEELQPHRRGGSGRTHTRVAEVDLITGTSGGSFTALALRAVRRCACSTLYENAFLKRDVEVSLVRRLFNPLTWPKVLTEASAARELAAEYLRRDPVPRRDLRATSLGRPGARGDRRRRPTSRPATASTSRNRSSTSSAATSPVSRFRAQPPRRPPCPSYSRR